MKPEIFREYDIRGIVAEDITVNDAQLIGRALVQYLVCKGEKSGHIVVGHDNRLSSAELAKSVLEGICSTGWSGVFLGMVPTPVYYYALNKCDAAGGIMITASHNPPEFNGFKVNHGRDSLFGLQIQELYRIIQASEFPSGTGETSFQPMIEQYSREIMARVQLQRPIKVVVDAGNGTAGLVAPQTLEAIGCQVVPLYCQLDGRFPNHHPDPTVEGNLLDLIDLVRSSQADLGIGYDGDSDRIGVVDENGTIIWGDRLLALFAKDLLGRHPGATIIYEVKCSMALEQVIKSAGGVPIMTKTGHSLIKKKMKDEQALLAGEMSGHMFFAENYFGFDDAIYASAVLVKILSETPQSFSAVMKHIPQYPSTPEIRIPCPENQKSRVVSELKEKFQARYPIIDVDGVRVIFEHGWGLVRISNTQPLLVLRFEALTQEDLDTIIALFQSELSHYPELDLSALK